MSDFKLNVDDLYVEVQKHTQKLYLDNNETNNISVPKVQIIILNSIHTHILIQQQ